MTIPLNVITLAVALSGLAVFSLVLWLTGPRTSWLKRIAISLPFALAGSGIAYPISYHIEKREVADRWAKVQEAVRLGQNELLRIKNEKREAERQEQRVKLQQEALDTLPPRWKELRLVLLREKSSSRYASNEVKAITTSFLNKYHNLPEITRFQYDLFSVSARELIAGHIAFGDPK